MTFGCLLVSLDDVEPEPALLGQGETCVDYEGGEWTLGPKGHDRSRGEDPKRVVAR
jgi:hypothetical protein